jgi:thiamine monophosphate kinase
MTGRSALARCGCAGKTSLERVVRPARRRLRERLRPTNVRLAGDLESGLVPNSTGLRRSPVDVGVDRTTSDCGLSGDAMDGHRWAVVSSLTARDAGGDVEAFTRHMTDVLGGLPTAAPTVLAKGHALQVASDTGSTAVGELLAPAGRARAGVRASNVDVIHAFPDLDPAGQAAVAAAHAFNDVYAMGAAADRSLRPIVGVPATARLPSADTVREWFADAVPATVEVLDPVVTAHGGTHRVYGGVALATTARQPPVRRRALAPGDRVLLHRPLGAVAAYAAAVDGGVTPAADTRHVERRLARHHDDVAQVIEERSPAPGARPDWERHVKVAVDVSGEGLLGLARHCGRGRLSLRLDALPLVEPDLVEAARRRWLLPDATIGTNGPLATVGAPAAIEGVRSALAARGIDATVVGELVADADGWLVDDTDRDLAALLESPRLINPTDAPGVQP